jgi:hypothetical protein
MSASLFTAITEVLNKMDYILSIDLVSSRHFDIYLVLNKYAAPALNRWLKRQLIFGASPR